MEYKVRGFTFGIAPKAEKPGDIPKIRKLATLKQYGVFNGIPPGFSPAERFFRQRPGGYGSYEGCRPPVPGFILDPLFYKASTTLKNLYFLINKGRLLVDAGTSSLPLFR